MVLRKNTTTGGIKLHSHYGEINLAIAVQSLLEDEEFHSLMDDRGLRAKLFLESPCGQKYEAEVLDIILNWSNENDI